MSKTTQASQWTHQRGSRSRRPLARVFQRTRVSQWSHDRLLHPQRPLPGLHVRGTDPRPPAGDDHLLDVVDQRTEVTARAPWLEPHLSREGFCPGALSPRTDPADNRGSRRATGPRGKKDCGRWTVRGPDGSRRTNHGNASSRDPHWRLRPDASVGLIWTAVELGPITAVSRMGEEVGGPGRKQPLPRQVAPAALLPQRLRRAPGGRQRESVHRLLPPPGVR